MRIGIIGAGNIGGNLARRLTSLHHHVSIANSRGPQTLTDLAVETGATAVTVEEAPRDADLVIVTIPLKAIAQLPKGLLDPAAAGAAVIDTNNYYPQQRDGRIEPIEAGMTEARWVCEQLGRPTVKVFNNIYAQQILDRPTPPGTTGRRALPVSGDDPATKAVVMRLVDDLGFDPVDVGGLDDSWRYQPGQPAYGPDVDVAALRELLAAARAERAPEFRG
jgi:predicted dinucleotide-binding enzyme